MTGDKAIKWTTDHPAVAVAALVAASVSYRHAVDPVGQHGETGWLDKVYPLTVDGLIYASLMVLLNDARRGLKPHPKAYGALALGVSATLAVNVAAGLAYGVVGAIVAAWPAPALVISYELLMLIFRRSAAPAPAAGTPAPAPPEPPAELNGHAAHAAELFADDLAAGTVPGGRRIRKEMHLGQPRAQQVRDYLTELART